MNEDQKRIALSVVSAVAVGYFMYTNIKQSRADKRLERKTDMLLKINNFNDPSLIK